MRAQQLHEGGDRSARIAVGGFQHETNTFSRVQARLEDFLRADAWPPLVRGAEMVPAVEGMNLPVSGFIEAIRARGHEVVPLVWCSATPSGPVTESAFESIWAMIAAGLEGAGRVDGLYLDLHGAMVTDHLDDGEGEILRRARSMVGAQVPIAASLDLHANTTRAMLKYCTILVPYRTYPHVDMAETGRRAAGLLLRALSSPLAFRSKHLTQMPFLMPLPWQCTLMEPMASLMEEAGRFEVESDGIANVSLTPGFPLADIRDCGPAVFAFGRKRADVAGAVRALEEMVLEKEEGFAGRLFKPEDSVAHALRSTGARAGPVILADTQDNPGGGGTSDGVTLVKILSRSGADAVVGIVYDPEVAAKAHSHGVGTTIHVKLGGKSGVPGESPLDRDCVVEQLGNGSIVGTGPFYGGCRMELGPMALLRFGEVSVIVSSRKQQAADQAMFHHLGIRPEKENILVLKSSVHFRADFSQIASEILLVESPGYNVADPAKLPFRRLRNGLRLSPMGQPFVAATQ
jgi:microcystin degradation protein MlrC